jgi:hypothetical protein
MQSVRAAQAFEILLLQDTQQLRLQFKWNIPTTAAVGVVAQMERSERRRNVQGPLLWQSTGIHPLSA